MAHPVMLVRRNQSQKIANRRKGLLDRNYFDLTKSMKTRAHPAKLVQFFRLYKTDSSKLPGQTLLLGTPVISRKYLYDYGMSRAIVRSLYSDDLLKVKDNYYVRLSKVYEYLEDVSNLDKARKHLNHVRKPRNHYK